MQDIASLLLQAAEQQVIWLAGFFIAFGALARISPCNKGQPWWRKGSFVDILYYFVMPVFTRFVRVLFISVGVGLLFFGQSSDTISHYLTYGYGPLARLPVWLQAALMFIIADVMLYWTHRWFHGKEMWRFHAIHHSPEQVDWLSTYRFHPINIWLSFTAVDALMVIAGFSPEAAAAMAVFNQIYSAMVHANLNWTFGPFRFLFASPVFHRWHHTAQQEGMDKNFAPTLPLLDIMFGTFYMPDGRRPEQYGIPGSTIPDRFMEQLVWPFKNRGT